MYGFYGSPIQGTKGVEGIITRLGSSVGSSDRLKLCASQVQVLLKL